MEWTVLVGLRALAWALDSALGFCAFVLGCVCTFSFVYRGGGGSNQDLLYFQSAPHPVIVMSTSSSAPVVMSGPKQLAPP